MHLCYDFAGRLTLTTHSNGTSYTRSYDPSGRVLAVSGTNTNLTFTLDAIRPRAVGYRPEPGQGDELQPPTRRVIRLASMARMAWSRAYTYDQANRLKTITSGA